MTNNFFKSSLDQVFAELLKQAGGPPLLPEEVGMVSPWDEDVGEDKPIGLMTKEDLANFIRGLDDQTFNELKSILDKIEMPEADDLDEEADDLDEEVEEVLGPEKTVDEAMKELPENERSEFLNKLRHSKAHKLSNRKIAVTEEEYLRNIPEKMKDSFRTMPDKEKTWLLNLPWNPEDITEQKPWHKAVAPEENISVTINVIKIEEDQWAAYVEDHSGTDPSAFGVKASQNANSGWQALLQMAENFKQAGFLD